MKPKERTTLAEKLGSLQDTLRLMNSIDTRGETASTASAMRTHAERAKRQAQNVISYRRTIERRATIDAWKDLKTGDQVLFLDRTAIVDQTTMA